MISLPRQALNTIKRGQQATLYLWLSHMQHRARILELLTEANTLFKAIGEEPLWCTRWDTGQQISIFIEECDAAIRHNELSGEQFRELWLIFAPTCTWDDNGGGVELGNDIFELLDRQRSDYDKTDD